ncbi:hypothetical protein TNCT_500741 [Trichonephila clavata]|uniref:Uncharacterized protein n=1 Tax=Trichonephila clavata TaxID=2740835 RepID=A0A8X6HCT2_TRICU|nr:hypothetical protein TNCT_500741 [Trichonephila clavata]
MGGAVWMVSSTEFEHASRAPLCSFPLPFMMQLRVLHCRHRFPCEFRSIADHSIAFILMSRSFAVIVKPRIIPFWTAFNNISPNLLFYVYDTVSLPSGAQFIVFNASDQTLPKMTRYVVSDGSVISPRRLPAAGSAAEIEIRSVPQSTSFITTNDARLLFCHHLVVLLGCIKFDFVVFQWFWLKRKHRWHERFQCQVPSIFRQFGVVCIKTDCAAMPCLHIPYYAI